MEIWNYVKDYENDYMVSNIGRIKSIKKSHIIMKNQVDRYGYNYIKLTINGVSKKYKVHRLVAIAFIDNINKYDCINHKDGNKQNNSHYNLEWCTVSQNNTHKVNMIYLHEYNGEFKTIPNWAKDIGISPTTLRARLKAGMSFEDAMMHKKYSSLIKKSVDKPSSTC